MIQERRELLERHRLVVRGLATTAQMEGLALDRLTDSSSIVTEGPVCGQRCKQVGRCGGSMWNYLP